MTFLVEAGVRAGTFAAVAGLLVTAFRVKAAAPRQRAWRLVLYVALALPLVCWADPRWAWQVPVPLPEASAASAFLTRSSQALRGIADGFGLPQTSGARPPATDADALPWSVFLFGIYTVGALLLFIRAGVGWVAALGLRKRTRRIDDPHVKRRLQARARALGLRDTPGLAESARALVPMTVGITRPLIVLPGDWRTWTEEKLDVVLTHEASHVARRDAATLTLSLLHRALMWFSPFSWWLHRHLADLGEYASDEAVLAAGADPAEYAETLVSFYSVVSRRSHRVAWHVAMARRGSPARRLRHILDWRGNRNMQVSNATIAALFVCAIPAAVATASVRPLTLSRDLPFSKPTLAHAWEQRTSTVIPAVRAKAAWVPRHVTRSRPQLSPARNGTVESGIPAGTSFAGRWIPADPVRNRALFDVGLADITALGMTITQDADTLTISRPESAATIARRAIAGFESTTVYRLRGPHASGAPTDAATATWEGETLVVISASPRGEMRTVYSLDSDLLRVDTEFRFNDGRATRVVLLYTREA